MTSGREIRSDEGKGVVLLVAFLVLFQPGNLSAQMSSPTDDTAITVLLVRDFTVSQERAIEQFQYLFDTWNNTALSTIEPTTLVLANGGTPVLYSGVFQGSESIQLGLVEAYANSFVPASGGVTIREFHGADLVIGLGDFINPSPPSSLICGRADQEHWSGTSGTFNPDPATGLDLAGQDDSFVAITAHGPQCQSFSADIVAHEFGHLLGGGHFDSLVPEDVGLNDNSRAFAQLDVVTLWPFPQMYVWRTPLARPSNSVCAPLVGTVPCLPTPQFSNDLAFGNALYSNADTFDLTARSVANYQVGTGIGPLVALCSDGIDNDGDSFVDSGDPDCAVCGEESCPFVPPPICDATVAPTNVQGSLVLQCVPGTSQSKYIVDWNHACPQAVDKYVIWTSQPDGAFPIPNWHVYTQSTFVFILGPEGRVRVQSCGIGGCSGLSNSSFLALDIC